MKSGITLQDLGTKIQRQAQSAKDFLARPQQISVAVLDDKPRLRLGERDYGMNDVFHDQLRTNLSIPSEYYDRMRAVDPGLLATNANAWLQRMDASKKRMVRTILDDNEQPLARAFLSERFHNRLDNYSLIGAVMPILLETQGIKIESCQLSEKKLYIKAITDRVVGEVKVGETVMAGVSISNSEVGCGFLKIEPLIYTLRCTNGMIIQDSTLRKSHVGRSQSDLGDEIQALLSNEAKQADDRAFFLKVRDVTRASLDDAMFRKNLQKLQSAAKNEIKNDKLDDVVELAAKRFKFNEDESAGILAHLIRGGDLSQWGLCSAVTRYSQDIQNYDRATELEYVGSSIVELAAPEWDRLASVN